ncbi:unnamed protein product [Amaranthus hypochondriacus]
MTDLGYEDGVDRISCLPDHILCHILSFLPTKYAVGTSILSTRWKYLWTSVSVLNFDFRVHGGLCSALDMNANPRSESTFQNFVNRVMLLNDVTHVQKFRLIYECRNNPAPICTWLHVAISRNIVELELDLYLFIRDEYVKLPKSFFVSNTLVILKLSCIPLSIPSFVCLPMLKILKIRRVMGLSDKCIQNLLSGCSVLEELVIEETTREKPRVIDLSIDTLKRFSFSYRFVIDMSVDLPYKFIVDSPNLEYFHVKGRISDAFVIKSLAILVTAHLDLRQTGVGADSFNLCVERVSDLFKGIPNVKFISLSNDIVQLLCASYDLNLPRFPNLTRLAIGIGVGIGWKRLMTKFVKCSPNLNVLTLDNKQGIIRDLKELRKNPSVRMPEYLVSHVKGFIVEELYFNFVPEAVEYLLQDLNVLKKLELNCQCPFLLKNQIGYASDSDDSF